MRINEINYSAVSHVVTIYLWDRGLMPDSDRDLPRRIRDRIRQALRGERLSYETLTWLIEAFDFNASDTHRMWDAFAGGSVVNLGGEGIKFTLRTPPVPMVNPQKHRTCALFSRYYIDTERMLRRIETSHALVSLEDGVDTFGYSPRDTLIDLKVIAGGTLLRFHNSIPGFIGVELKLDRPLPSGQHASLQYYTTHRATSAPCTQVRRAARNRIDDLDIRVIFDGTLPRKAWWCAWDSYDGGNTVQKTPVEIINGSELHQFVPYVEQAVVGFQWQW